MNKPSKHLFIVAFSFFSLISCKKETVKDVPTTDSTSIITHSLKSDSAIINPADTLYNLVDKSVIGTNVLTKSSLAPRLKTIMGIDYDEMVQDWNTETPFTKEGDILHASGCKQHDCTNYSYDLYIDIKANKINVYKFTKSKLTVFTEDNFTIELKDLLLKDLETKKMNTDVDKGK